MKETVKIGSKRSASTTIHAKDNAIPAAVLRFSQGFFSSVRKQAVNLWPDTVTLASLRGRVRNR
jgi:hypothetical protein